MANKNIEVTTFVDDCEKITNIGGVLVWDLKDVLTPLYEPDTVTIHSDEEAKEMLGISDAFIDLLFDKYVYPTQILLRPKEASVVAFSSLVRVSDQSVALTFMPDINEDLEASTITIERSFREDLGTARWNISRL